MIIKSSNRNSEIFDTFVIEMLKKADIKKEVAESVGKNLSDIAEEVIEKGMRVIPDVAKTVTKVPNSELVDLSVNAKKLSSQIDSISEAALAAEKGRQIPARYKNWDRKKFLDELKKARVQLKNSKEKVKALKDSGDLAKDELQKANFIIGKTQNQITESEEVILKLQNELSDFQSQNAKLIKELESSNKIIKSLEENSVKINSEMESLLKKHSETAKELGELQALLEMSKKVGKEGTEEFKTVSNAASKAKNELSSLTNEIQKKAPKASNEIISGTDELVDSSKKSTVKSIKDNKGRITPSESFLGAAAKRLATKTIDSITDLIVGGVSKFSGLFVLAATVGASYWYFFAEDDFADKLEVISSKIVRNIRKSKSKLSVLKFKNDSFGSSFTKKLISKLEESELTFLKLPDSLEDRDEFLKLSKDIDSLYELILSYLDSKDQISKDLISTDGFDEAINSLLLLKSDLEELNELYQSQSDYSKVKEETKTNKNQESSRQQAKESLEPMGKPFFVNIYKREIDASHLSPSMKSASFRIIEKVMNTPAGMAFSDPNNIWGGGFLRTTGDKNSDFLQDLKFLILNKISNQRELVRFVKQNMPKDSTKRLSGWKKALKYYRKNKESILDGEKTANKKKSNEFLLKGKLMDKKADSFSNSYYADAIKGLSEEFSKNYYSELESMHNNLLGGNSKSSENKLYDVTDETGAELVQRSHPEAVYVAESRGKGGLVENVVEQQNHNIEIALNVPSGNFKGRYAKLLNSLVKISEETNKVKRFDISETLNETIEKINKLK